MLWSWIGLVESSGIQIVYKPGKDDQLADSLSRNPIWEIADVAVLNSDKQLRDQICASYPQDPAFKVVHHALLEPPQKVDKSLVTKIKHYELVGGLLYY
ncbi:hypothetical protein GGF38_006268, partial [Coemansia sp. RSA 25]